ARLRALAAPALQADRRAAERAGPRDAGAGHGAPERMSTVTAENDRRPLPRWLLVVAAILMLAALVTPALVVLSRDKEHPELKPEAGVRVGRVPTDVAVAGSTVWVVSGRDDRLVSFDVGQPEASPIAHETGQAPLRVAAGEGSIWTADAGDDTVTRIDPQLPG